MAHRFDLPIGRAQTALDAAENARDLDDAASEWEVYLVFWRQALNKLDASGRSRFGRGGWLPINERISSDEGLSYLHEARNTVEHGLLHVTEQRPPELAIGGPGLIHIDRLEIVNGVIVQGAQHLQTPAGRHLIRFDPGGLSLAPLKVKERGKTKLIPVPLTCLGEDVDPASPFDLGRLGMMFVNDVRREVLGCL